jgi:hypothetical protein
MAQKLFVHIVDSARLTSAERKSEGMQIDLIWVRLPRPS